MESLREWIFRILCAALISGILTAFPMGEGTKKLLRFVCGLFLTTTLLSGLPGVEVSQILDELLPETGEIPAPVAEGEEMSGAAIRQLIIQETEAYILHKATALGMDIRVDVFLSEGEFPVPEAVTIQGTCTEERKRSLTDWMEAELGIPEEDQRWMG